MEINNKSIKNEYKNELNAKTLKIGLLFSIIGIPLYFASLFQDLMILKIPEFLIFRTLASLPFIVFIILYFLLFKKNNSTVLMFHILNLFNSMIMISGMNLIVFIKYGTTENIVGIMTATIMTIFAIFLFSSGARNHLFYIFLAPIGFLYYYLFIYGKLSVTAVTYLNNYLMFSVVLIILGIIFEKMSFNEFKMKKLADERKKFSEYAKKEAEKSKKMAKSAENESKLKSKFLAIMSHELRTPLNSIIGFTNLLLNKEENLNKKNQIEIIHNQSESLLKIVNDILDISCIESGKIQIKNSIFNLEEFINNIIKKMNVDFVKKNNKIIFEKDEFLTRYVISDSLRLEQIIINLLSNANKFTKDGTVKIKIKEENVITDNSKKFIFIISDNGIGIQSNKLKYVFRKFTQVYDTTSRKYGGTGLGLFIVKEFVELLKGKISVESKLDVGSIFTVELVMQLPDNKSINNIDEKDQNHMNDGNYNFDLMKIIVAEDNIANQELVIKMLETKKCKVFIANNGYDVLKLLEENRYDLILMDIEMPELDGYETTKKIRNSNNNYRDIPIIALTAYAMEKDKLKIINAGANDFIAKPIKLDSFYETINKYKNK